MTAWLLIALVWAVLFAFWLWLGALFDWITDHHLKAAYDGEDAQATKGTGSC